MVAPKDFFNKIKAGAYYSWTKYKILPSVVAAQAALESGWGESKLTREANNLFGIKGTYKGQSVTMSTREETASGGSFYVNAQFRKYPNWASSIADHGELVGTASRYRAAVGETNYVRSVTAIKNGGYATDTQYISKIVSTIESNNLQAWDRDAIAGGDGGSFDFEGSGSDGDEYKTFVQNYIKENSATRPKIKQKDIKAIVIHEISENTTAKAFRETLNGGYSGRKQGYHIVVDDKDVIGTVPLNEGVYHSNRGAIKLNGIGNPDETTISIGIISKGKSFSSETLAKAMLATAEISTIYSIPSINIFYGFMVDGVREPLEWVENHFLYTTYIALVQAVKEKGANVILNPDYGKETPGTGGQAGQFIPGGEGVIKKLIEEALFWEGKLSYSQPARFNIYPGGSADCSSYTQYVFKKVTGRDIGGTTWPQVTQGKEIPVTSARAGDLVFFNGDNNPPSHVGLVIGPDMMINCQNKGVIVEKISPWHSYGSPPYRARRLFSDSEFDQSQQKPPTKPTINPKNTYVINVKAPVNATNSPTGGVSQKRLAPNEVYRVEEVSAQSLKIGDNLWVPRSAQAFTVSALPTSNAPIGTLTTKIQTRVMDAPSNNAKEFQEKGTAKIIPKSNIMSIYAYENGFAKIDPDLSMWAVASQAYGIVDINLVEEFIETIDFSKGQAIETNVYSKVYEKDYTTIELSIAPKNGVSIIAHELLLPIGSIVEIDVPTNRSLNRTAIVVSNSLSVTDGNSIEILFDNELEQYKFGSRKSFVKLIKQVEAPGGINIFFNNEQEKEVDPNDDFS